MEEDSGTAGSIKKVHIDIGSRQSTEPVPLQLLQHNHHNMSSRTERFQRKPREPQDVKDENDEPQEVIRFSPEEEAVRLSLSAVTAGLMQTGTPRRSQRPESHRQ